jgi:hypothetical protein
MEYKGAWLHGAWCRDCEEFFRSPRKHAKVCLKCKDRINKERGLKKEARQRLMNTEKEVLKAHKKKGNRNYSILLNKPKRRA